MTEMISALKGALDYTRAYRGRTFVIKTGGEVLARADTTANLAEQIALLESLSIRVVLVHGGGPQATTMSERLGITPEIVAGRRVTSPEVLEVAKMVFAGQINVDLLAALRKVEVRGVGLSGVDGDLITATRRPSVRVHDDDGTTRIVDFGAVGDVERVDTRVLGTLLDGGYVPVIASLAADASGQPLNMNADTLAEVLASSLGAEKLVFLTSSPGLLRNVEDPSSLVPFATPTDLEALTIAGGITRGMRPKIEACIQAVRSGVRRTHIIDGRRADALLIELFTGAGCGTMIVNAKERQSYEENEMANNGDDGGDAQRASWSG
ncbi:MAG: acetylglutamate kinase [Deltaproteobacteria bacterium RIFOXYA12_FULL_58_15]|nr:MAG: acetylglutamate kinase [Deltaproteobacteria bacterium RIFOXYA12_FULL_58_15]OGR15236.1 MAG: acetylglutamate kinase [Deltaproteobacteria bacterium RIFOXYB12_FULL_58_9]